MKILVDAMGGDNAPLCVLQGVSQAAAEFGDGMELVLLGEEKAIRDCAKENKIDLAPFEILNCTETIDMHDDPVKAVRHKKDSSLVKGLTMLKNGEADAFVSAGSTGALHVGTSLIVRTVKGVKRPALATPMPGAKQNFLLLDCGANVECRPEMLNAFGTMGTSTPRRSWAAKRRRRACQQRRGGHEGHADLPRGPQAAEGKPLHPLCGQHRAALHHGR